MRRALLSLLFAACSAHEDALPDLGRDMATTPPLTGTYAGSVVLASDIDVDYAGTSTTALVSSVHIAGGVGTIDFQGTTYPALAYEHIPFGMYDLAAIVATTDTGLVVTYAYCTAGVLGDLYTESLMLAPTDEPSTPQGTCSFSDTSTTVDVAFTKPTSLAYDTPADVADVDGADLVIHGGTGTVNVEGTTYDVDVFTDVDCASCGGAGWRELHATISDGPTVLAFAIFYLEADMAGQVLLGYGVRFDQPDLWPPTRNYPASWTLK